MKRGPIFGTRLSRVIIFQGLSSIPVALVGCSDSKLSRSKATEIMKKSPEFMSDSVRLSHDLCVGICWSPESSPDSSLEYINRHRTVFHKAGYTEIRNLGLARRGGGSEFKITLTEKGQSFVRDLRVGSKDAETIMYVVDVARRQFLEVTGIQIQQTMAKIDFNWTWVPTPRGNDLINSGGSKIDEVGPLQQGTAIFSLYDDGWRLRSVQW